MTQPSQPNLHAYFKPVNNTSESDTEDSASESDGNPNSNS